MRTAAVQRLGLDAPTLTARLTYCAVVMCPVDRTASLMVAHALLAALFALERDGQLNSLFNRNMARKDIAERLRATDS